MKKTLSILLTLGSCAFATTAEFSTLTGTTEQNGITMTDGVITGSDNQKLYSTYPGYSLATTSFVLTFNLTDIEKIVRTTKEELVTVSVTGGTTVGLYLNADGSIIGRWGDATNGTATSLTTMASNDNVFINADGDSCLALSFVLSLTHSYSGPGGFMGYDADGTAVFSNGGLGATGNKVFSEIKLNTSYITWASINTNPETNKINVPTWAAAQIPSSQLVPEPTTATLSLLALAGLTARRRRK